MMDIININTNSISDKAIVASIGEFIKYHRLNQNKSQQQLAEEAGINRSTLVQLEKGNQANIITFVQLLRSLNLLHIFQQFKVQSQPSPIQLAELEQKKRKRASKKNKSPKKNKSDW